MRLLKKKEKNNNNNNKKRYINAKNWGIMAKDKQKKAKLC